MKQLVHSDLVKPLLVRDGPDGLYPKPLIWMEGQDMAGFNAQFAYTVINEKCSFHPVSGSVMHPYNELLVFAGVDPNDILFLGAEISIELGEEREEYIFTEPTVITIPSGLPHGPIKIRRLYKPIVHYMIALEPNYYAVKAEANDKLPNSSSNKYAHLVKRLICNFDETTDVIYTSMTDKRGVMGTKLTQDNYVGPGNSDEVVWMFGKDLEEFNVNFTWGHFSKAGKWHRGGEIHQHPEEEVLIFVGLDPNDLTYLGCEIECGMGNDAERHIFSKPTVAVCPKGFPHLPVITRWCDKPYAFIVACLDGGHASPWVDEQDE